MTEALLPHSLGGPVEVCIGVCSTEYRTTSTQIYSFVVSPSDRGGSLRARPFNLLCDG